MIKLILAELLNKKTVIIYFVWISSCVFVIYNISSSLSLVKVNIGNEEILMNFNNMFRQIFSILFIWLTVFLVYNHDQHYINNLSTFTKRSNIISLKMTIYLILITLNFILFTTVYLIIIRLNNCHFLFNKTIVKAITSLYFDNCLVLLCFLLLNRNYNKNISLLIIIFYSVKIIFDFFDKSKIIFYLLPFYNINFSLYKFTNFYQILYIILLILLNFFRYNNEELK